MCSEDHCEKHQKGYPTAVGAVAEWEMAVRLLQSFFVESMR
jgi:hypothetical protein